MKLKTRSLLPLTLLTLCSPMVAAQGAPEAVNRIIKEGQDNSQVWETLTYLSKEIGPRLTGSAALDRASAWTRDEFRRLGLENLSLQRWGEVPVRFDRGPSYARMTSPVERELEFTTRSWDAGTNGPVSGRVLMMPTSYEELDEIVWALEGAWMLTERTPRRGRNETDEQRIEREQRAEIQKEVDEALSQNHIAGRLVASSNELVITSSTREWRELTMDTIPTDVTIQIRRSDYDALKAEIEAGKNVVVEADLPHHFTEGPFGVYNTIAEIPGTDMPEEVVIFSGHLDTWDGPGTEGAQDNGTGSAVMLEAARILMASGIKPKRTIRFILWTGEEQGLFGSRYYVDSLSELEKELISACFVDDGGTNYQGGANCIASMKPMLDAAIAPVVAAFPELPMENRISDRMPMGGGSDHAPFNRKGIPGFFWRESGSGGREGKNYTFVHHTQHDTMRYAVEEYLVQAATCTAVVAYQLAEAYTMLPRELPEAVAVKVDPNAPFVVEAGALSGLWKANYEESDMTFMIDLETGTNGRLRGSVEGPGGKQQLTSGEWNAGQSSAVFACSSMMGDMEFNAKVVEGSLVGTMKAPSGVKMGFKGVRKATGKDVSEQDVDTTGTIAGVWNGILPSMNDSPFTISVNAPADGVVTGRFRSSSSNSELFNGKWNATTQTLTFEYDYPHADKLPVEARLKNGALEGAINGNLEFTATRAKP